MARAPAVAPLRIADAGFVPSGWMGDAATGRFVALDLFNRESPRSASPSVKVTYTPGPLGWTAIGWQYPESNWGDVEGRNWRDRVFREVSVWARGAPDRNGAFPSVQFKAGGHTDPARRHQASFAVSGEFVTLTERWTRHTIDISNRDLSNVASAFVVVIRASGLGPGGATFWLDAIEYR